MSSYGARLTRLRPDLVAWLQGSYTEPGHWWIAPDDRAPRPTALASRASVDLSGHRVTREMATSKDGTQVPSP